jgi:hypothetical protein
MFQAVQAVFKRFCLPPMVSPTHRKPAVISEIISDISRFGVGAECLACVMFGIAIEFTTGPVRCPREHQPV